MRSGQSNILVTSFCQILVLSLIIIVLKCDTLVGRQLNIRHWNWSAGEIIGARQISAQVHLGFHVEGV